MPEHYQRVVHHPSRRDESRHYDTEETIISSRDNNPGITKAQQVVQLIVGVISGLLLVRFLLALFGANTGNALVGIVYDITAPLISPFRGLFTIEAGSGAARFEIETLIATIVYILLGMAIVRLLDVFREA